MNSCAALQCLCTLLDIATIVSQPPGQHSNTWLASVLFEIQKQQEGFQVTKQPGKHRTQSACGYLGSDEVTCLIVQKDLVPPAQKGSKDAQLRKGVCFQKLPLPHHQ